MYTNAELFATMEEFSAGLAEKKNYLYKGKTKRDYI